MVSLFHLRMERSELIRDFMKRFRAMNLAAGHCEHLYSDTGSQTSYLS